MQRKEDDVRSDRDGLRGELRTLDVKLAEVRNERDNLRAKMAQIHETMDSKIQEAVQTERREHDRQRMQWDSDKADLRRQVIEAERRTSSIEDEHRRELMKLGEQVKATLKRERLFCFFVEI